MKNKRHNKIIEIIESDAIETQDDLISRLREQGFTGGFMAWNASCSLTKLEELRPLYEALED